MPEIWTMGEMLVEIMRPRAGMQLSEAGQFFGPFPSGAPAIFIDTVARLGHSAGIIGGVGRDDFGACITNRLRSHGVDLRFVQVVPDRSTAVAFVVYFVDGSRKFIYHIDGTPAAASGFPRDPLPEVPRFFHVMGCSLMVNDRFRESIFEATKFFHERGAKISFDPNIRPELLAGQDIHKVVGPVLERCSVLLPGVAELELLAGVSGAEPSARALFKSGTLEIIVLKRGKSGATLLAPQRTIDVPAYAVKEVDPTGAGDSFDAGFLCGLLENRPIEECGRMAAAAGALNTSAFGPMEGDISTNTVRGLMEKGASTSEKKDW
ncbi:MAG: sugar kinase [Spirochaetia bacterium]|jgi:sugar/nucleoside kinase (ribokinase family)